MAGPKLHGTSAQTLFNAAKPTDLSSAARGLVIDPTNPPTTTTPTTDTFLEVSAYKSEGRKTGDLTWTGASGSEVFIVRDGVDIVGPVASSDRGSFTDSTGQKGGGLMTWKICELDLTTSSNVVELLF